MSLCLCVCYSTSHLFVSQTMRRTHRAMKVRNYEHEKCSVAELQRFIVRVVGHFFFLLRKMRMRLLCTSLHPDRAACSVYIEGIRSHNDISDIFMVFILPVKVSFLICPLCSLYHGECSAVGPGALKPSVGDGIESRRPCSALHFLSILFYVVCLFCTFTGVCINQ